jgi:hypothetical protein
MTDNAAHRDEREIAGAAKRALDRLCAGTLQRLAARIAQARDEKERGT